MEIRLNKFLAERLGLSRREADDAIAAGRAKINQNTAVLGARVAEGDEVFFDGRPVEFKKQYTYLVLNKPVGYVCSRKKQGENDTIYSLLPEKYRSLKTVGRLDKDTCGLLLLTDDGDLAFALTHPKFMKYKTYVAVLDRPLEPLHQQMIADFGVDLPDGKSQLALTCLDGETYSVPEVESPHRKIWQIGMSEGRNRQIRRTFAALGYRIVFLKRLEFDGLTLGNLKEGSFRLIPRPKN